MRRSGNHKAPPLSLAGNIRWGMLKPVLEKLEPTSILEMGVGLGSMGWRLSEFAPYEGVEPDSTSRGRAQVTLCDRDVSVHQSIEHVNSRSYDLVCAFEVLEHIEDDASALRLWASYVSDGGHLIMSVPAHQTMFGNGDLLVGHVRRYGLSQMDVLLKSAGLTPVSVITFGFPLLNAAQFFRNLVVARKMKSMLSQSVAERTAQSGRLLQMSGGWSALFSLLVSPLVFLHRRGLNNGPYGTSMFIVARKDSDAA
jgi:SAM-dependent methyltransferase